MWEKKKKEKKKEGKEHTEGINQSENNGDSTERISNDVRDIEVLLRSLFEKEREGENDGEDNGGNNNASDDSLGHSSVVVVLVEEGTYQNVTQNLIID